jgi:hypothetical protein
LVFTFSLRVAPIILFGPLLDKPIYNVLVKTRFYYRKNPVVYT